MSDQKYRQRGYKDDDRDSPRGRSGPRPPRPQKEGPRGRGLGAPTATVFRCAVCGGQVQVEGQVAFDQDCPHCEADLHTCTHCQHFDPSARFECRLDIPQPIRSKAKANTCELFEPKAAQEFAKETRSTKDAKSEFDALFNF